MLYNSETRVYSKINTVNELKFVEPNFMG
jgi:hypothetical protein